MEYNLESNFNFNMFFSLWKKKNLLHKKIFFLNLNLLINFKNIFLYKLKKNILTYKPEIYLKNIKLIWKI